MPEIGQSASASAKGQIGLLNIDGGVSLSPKFQTSGFVGSILAPISARRSAKAVKEINDAVAESMSTYMALSPTVTAERAYVMAMTGLICTERQADNLLAVLNAAANSARDGSDPSSIPQSTRDKILLGAFEADDEEVRAMWKSVILGEIDSPGRFSKRALSILSVIGSDEGRSFAKVCSLCAGGKNSDGSPRPLVPCIYIDPSGTSYCDGAIGFSEISELANLGLLVRDASQHYERETFFGLCIGDHVLLPSEKLTKRIRVGDVTFTKAGEELSTLCEIRTFPNLSRRLEEKFSTYGITLVDLYGKNPVDRFPKYLLDLIQDSERGEVLAGMRDIGRSSDLIWHEI